jgi:hypothetical protein
LNKSITFIIKEHSRDAKDVFIRCCYVSDSFSRSVEIRERIDGFNYIINSSSYTTLHGGLGYIEITISNSDKDLIPVKIKHIKGLKKLTETNGGLWITNQKIHIYSVDIIGSSENQGFYITANKIKETLKIGESSHVYRML